MACTVSAFQLALDVNVSIPRRSCPAAGTSRADSSWASCFQASSPEALPLRSDAEGVDIDGNLGWSKNRETINAGRGQEDKSDHSNLAASEELAAPPLCEKLATATATPEIKSFKSSLIIAEARSGELSEFNDASNFACEHGEGEKASKENFDQEIAVNSEFDVAFRLVSKRPASEPSFHETEDDDRLDEIISAAEILFSCRNVNSEHAEPPKGSKRRRTDPSSPKPPSSRKPRSKRAAFAIELAGFR